MNPVEYNKNSSTPEELLTSFIELNDSSWYIDPLLRFSSKCAHITELGIFQGQTIAAFLTQSPNKIVAYDIDLSLYDSSLFDKLKGNTILEIKQANSLRFTIEPTCFLFIDTRHVYEHVYTELKNHGNQASKFIAIHDTEYPPIGKRNNQFTCCPDKLVKDAVFDWMAENKRWSLAYQNIKNSGLMILQSN